MIAAKAVIISEPFTAAAPLLQGHGIIEFTVADLLTGEPVDPVETGEDDLALMQLTSGPTGSLISLKILHLLLKLRPPEGDGPFSAAVIT
jgi:fatty-acyl-CoA synthase